MRKLLNQEARGDEAGGPEVWCCSWSDLWTELQQHVRFDNLFHLSPHQHSLTRELLLTRQPWERSDVTRWLDKSPIVTCPRWHWTMEMISHHLWHKVYWFWLLKLSPFLEPFVGLCFKLSFSCHNWEGWNFASFLLVLIQIVRRSLNSGTVLKLVLKLVKSFRRIGSGVCSRHFLWGSRLRWTHRFRRRPGLL